MLKYDITPVYRREIKPLVDILATTGVPQEATCIYSGRNKLYTLRTAGITVNIKQFRVPAFPNSYIYTHLRPGKARRSYLHAQELLKRGITTPTPLAWLEITTAGRLGLSYYVSIQSPAPHLLRNWETWPPEQRDNVLRQYARFMHKMHVAGVQHHDLSPGNVLWDVNPADGNIVFEIVDLNRMTLRNRPLTRREAFTNFRNITLIPEECRRLGAFYGQAAGINPQTAADLAAKSLADDQRRKKRLHSIKKHLGL